MPRIFQGRQPHHRKLRPPRPPPRLRLPRPAPTRQPLPHLLRRQRLRHPHQARRNRHREPRTGRLTISLTELPQTPLTSFYMHFFGSERGLLATPTQCGEYPVKPPSPLGLNPPNPNLHPVLPPQHGSRWCRCPGPARPFNPGFQAVSLGHAAAAHTPFSLEVTRNDGDRTSAQ